MNDDNKTVIDFERDNETQFDCVSETVIERFSEFGDNRFTARSSDNMSTILDAEDDFGLALTSTVGGEISEQTVFTASNKDVSTLSDNMPTSQSEIYSDCTYQLPSRTMIGERYEILDVVGVGGFSIVYKAYDHKLDSVVAVKELFPPSIAYRNPGDNRVIVNSHRGDYEYLLDRFVLEARTMAKFNSDPNIVNIFDCVTENNTAYIIMELIQGCNLEDYIAATENKRLMLDEALPIMCEVLDGLERVHKKGIIHRDIKPKNIILTDSGEVKIIDFGAARFYASEKEVVNSLTKVLTPGFAPPEQYKSDKKQGAYTDVYASAATFFYMLTGKVPQSSVNRDVSDNLMPLSKLVDSIPDYVDKAVQRAMVLNSDLRIQRASEFKMALLGKKNIRTAQEEKRANIRNRFIISFVFVALICGCLAAALLFRQNYSSDKSVYSYIKNDDVIEIWLPKGDSDPSSIYDNIIESYKEYIRDNYGISITVNTRFIPDDEYAQTLDDAIQNDTMPDLFQSNGIDISSDKVINCDLVFDNLSKKSYALYQYYLSGSIDKAKMAVGFDTTVLYTNDKLLSELGIDEFQSYNDLISINITEKTSEDSEPELIYNLCSRKEIDGLSKNSKVYVGEDAAELFKDGKILGYIGNAKDYTEILQALPGYCSVHNVYESSSIPITLRTWSVYSNSRNKSFAAQAFVYYFVDEYAQDSMYLQNRDIFPVNVSVLSSYENYYPQFSFITDNTTHFTIDEQ